MNVQTISERKTYDNFSKFILCEGNWTVDNLLKLSIICELAFASGIFWRQCFEYYLSRKGKEKKFSLKWCGHFNSILLPFKETSGNTSSAGLDSKTTTLEEQVVVTNFTAGTDSLPETTENLPEYKKIESSFHRITSTLCPLVNLLRCPMGITKQAKTKFGRKGESNTSRLEMHTYGVAPYIVPPVNHRQKNPTLVQGLMGDTLMSETPSDHFSGEYTTLPICMVSSLSVEAPTKCALKSWDTLDAMELVGAPSALLLEGTLSDRRLYLLIHALQRKKNEDSPYLSLDQASITKSAQSLEPMYAKVKESRGRLRELGVHTMSKKLLNRQILKISEETDSVFELFSYLSTPIKTNVNSLSPFFPYCMSSDSIYPFHHLRVLLGALTNQRSSMVEGNHRSFVSLCGLLGGLGQAAPTVGAKLNTALLLMPAKVTDVLPCIPDKRSCEVDAVVRDSFVCVQLVRFVFSANTNFG